MTNAIRKPENPCRLDMEVPGAQELQAKVETRSDHRTEAQRDRLVVQAGFVA